LAFHEGKRCACNTPRPGARCAPSDPQHTARGRSRTAHRRFEVQCTAVQMPETCMPDMIGIDLATSRWRRRRRPILRHAGETLTYLSLHSAHGSPATWAVALRPLCCVVCARTCTRTRVIQDASRRALASGSRMATSQMDAMQCHASVPSNAMPKAKVVSMPMPTTASMPMPIPMHAAHKKRGVQ